jgi:hypothetical protein
VIGGRERAVGSSYATAGVLETLESLRAGDFVN